MNTDGVQRQVQVQTSIGSSIGSKKTSDTSKDQSAGKVDDTAPPIIKDGGLAKMDDTGDRSDFSATADPPNPPTTEKSDQVAEEHFRGIAAEFDGEFGNFDVSIDEGLENISNNQPELLEIDLNNEEEALNKIDQIVKQLCPDEAAEFDQNLGADGISGIGKSVETITYNFKGSKSGDRQSPTTRLILADLKANSTDGSVSLDRLKTTLTNIKDGSCSGKPNNMKTKALVNTFIKNHKKEAFDHLSTLANLPRGATVDSKGAKLDLKDIKIKVALDELSEKTGKTGKALVNHLKTSYNLKREATYGTTVVKGKVRVQKEKKRLGKETVAKQSKSIPMIGKLIDGQSITSPSCIGRGYSRKAPE